jgi:hypothetical protein
MAEVAEYALVLLASSLLVGGSIAVATRFGSSAAGAEDRAALGSLDSLASAAFDRGSASARIPVSGAMVECHGATLELSSKSYNGTAPVLLPCDFAYGPLGGVRTFNFTCRGGALELEVS